MPLRPYSSIIFPATQSASSDVNTLDDYEEGTWTPAFHSFSDGGTGFSISSNVSAKYNKVGKVVSCTFNFDMNASKATTSASMLEISGLPFTPDSLYPSISSNTVSIGGGAGFFSIKGKTSTRWTDQAFGTISVSSTGRAMLHVSTTQVTSGSISWNDDHCIGHFTYFV
tara:strand:+ start:471 stop:977 length:507 start_codon:yes stop_codon:yes gene_type:complete